MADINVDDKSTGSENMIGGGSMDGVSAGSPPTIPNTNPGVSTDSGTGSSMDPMASATGSDSSMAYGSSTMPGAPQDPMLSGSGTANAYQNPIDSGMGSEANPTPNMDTPDMTPTPMPAEDSKVKAFKPKTKMFSLLRLVGEVLLIAIIVFLVMQNRSLKNDKTSLQAQINTLNQQTAAAKDKQAAVVTAVGKAVPSLASETPAIVTITSADLTSTSTFFATAKDGDQLLVYVKSGQAIIYRPSTGKIVVQGPVTFTVTPTTAAAATSATAATKP